MPTLPNYVIRASSVTKYPYERMPGERLSKGPKVKTNIKQYSRSSLNRPFTNTGKIRKIGRTDSVFASRGQKASKKNLSV